MSQTAHHPVAVALLKEISEVSAEPKAVQTIVQKYKAIIRNKHAQDRRLCLSLMLISGEIASRGCILLAGQLMALSRVGLEGFKLDLAFDASRRSEEVGTRIVNRSHQLLVRPTKTGVGVGARSRRI